MRVVILFSPTALTSSLSVPIEFITAAMLLVVFWMSLLFSLLIYLKTAKQSNENFDSNQAKSFLQARCPDAIESVIPASVFDPCAGNGNGPQFATVPLPSNDNPPSSNGISVSIDSETTTTNVNTHPPDSLHVLAGTSSTTPGLSTSIPSDTLAMGHSITPSMQTFTRPTSTNLAPDSDLNNPSISVTGISKLKNTPSTSEASQSSRALHTVSSSATNEPQDLIEASNGLSSAGLKDTLNAGPQSRSNSESTLSHPMASGQIPSLSSTPTLSAAASLQKTPASIESNPFLGAESTKLPALILGSQTITPVVQNHYAVVNGQTPTIGSASAPSSDGSTKDIALQTVSDQSLLVVDSSSSQVSVNAATSAISEMSPLPTVNGHNITANIPGQYEINGHTSTPGNVATVSGTPPSLAPNASDNVAATSTKSLSTNNTTRSNSGPAGTSVQVFKGGVRGARHGLWSSSIALLVGIAVLLWL